MWALEWGPVTGATPEAVPPVFNGPVAPTAPVLRGRPRAHKGVPELGDTASPVHHTATVEGTWNAGVNVGRLPSPMTVATAKRMYGWYDGDQVSNGEIIKGACKLPHHQVSEDGTVGAANLNGVRNALSRLPQSDIPEAEQEAVRRHLRAHLEDGGAEPEDHADWRPGARMSGTREWFRLANQADDTAVIDIYDEIGWFGVSADRLVAEIKQLRTATIQVNINSPGGDMWDGIAIYNALVEHPARIEVKVDALAASAASVIAQAGDKVTMAGASQMMIHDAWGLCAGQASDMEAMAALLNQASDNLAQLYAGTTGEGTPAEWRDLMRAETWYNAQEAVDAGLADEALPIEQRGQRSRPEDSFDLSGYRHAGRSQAPAPRMLKAATRGAAGTTIPEGGPGPRLGQGSGGSNGRAAAGAAPGDDGDNPVDDLGAAILAALGDTELALDERALLDAAESAGLGAEADAARDVVDPFHFDADIFEAVMARANRAVPGPTDRQQPQAPDLPAVVPVEELIDAIKEGALP